MFLFCSVFFLLQSVVGIFLWLFGTVFLVSVLLSDFFGFWLVWVFMCCCIFFCIFGFFFERTQLVFNTMLFVLFLYHFSLSCGILDIGDSLHNSWTKLLVSYIYPTSVDCNLTWSLQISNVLVLVFTDMESFVSATRTKTETLYIWRDYLHI